MLLIKLSVKICVLLVLCVFLFTSCTNPFKSHSYTEVNFNEIKDVQLTYKQNIYDIKLQFSRSVLNFTFGENNTAYDGIGYKVTPQNCQVFYSGLTHSFDKDTLPDNYLPVLIWQFFSENGNVFVTENYDSQKDCCYLERTINNDFVKLQVYENQGNISYTLIIT